MNKAFLVGAFLLAGSAVSAQGKPLYTFPLGVEAYTYRNSWPRGVAQTLDTIRMLGFTELEGIGGRMDPREFRKLCDERGISIPSIGADYNKLLRAPDSVIGLAKIMGASYVMCAVLREARKIGIRHYFIEDESVDPTIPVPKSIAYLKSLAQ